MVNTHPRKQRCELEVSRRSCSVPRTTELSIPWLHTDSITKGGTTTLSEALRSLTSSLTAYIENMATPFKGPVCTPLSMLSISGDTIKTTRIPGFVFIDEDIFFTGDLVPIRHKKSSSCIEYPAPRLGSIHMRTSYSNLIKVGTPEWVGLRDVSVAEIVAHARTHIATCETSQWMPRTLTSEIRTLGAIKFFYSVPYNEMVASIDFVHKNRGGLAGTLHWGYAASVLGGGLDRLVTEKLNPPHRIILQIEKPSAEVCANTLALKGQCLLHTADGLVKKQSFYVPRGYDARSFVLMTEKLPTYTDTTIFTKTTDKIVSR